LGSVWRSRERSLAARWRPPLDRSSEFRRCGGNPTIPRSGCSDTLSIMANYSPGLNGVVIGLLSSFGSAILILCIFLAFYFFRYTASGRIFLDRIGRPGEYDDEQAFAREEAEALETMDDMQRTEYLRAKGV